jgi:hypothetical protein
MRMVTDRPVKLGRKQHYRASVREIAFELKCRVSFDMPVTKSLCKFTKGPTRAACSLRSCCRLSDHALEETTANFFVDWVEAIGVTLPVRLRAGMAPR